MKTINFCIVCLFSSGIFFSSSIFAQKPTIPAKESVQALTPAQVKAVKQVVHDYLVESPEVLIEASKSLQEKQRQKMQEDAEKGVKKNFKQLISSKHSPVLGNPNGQVVLVEFVDYQCTHCRTMSAVVRELAKQNKDLKVVIKHLPIFGEQSEFAARASLAAQKQGKEKFLNFHKSLFNAKTRLSEKVVMNLAKSAKLNEAKLRKDMSDAEVRQELDANSQLAGELKLPGTPAFLIANQSGTEVAFIPGAIPNPEKEFQALIDKARETKK